MDRPELARPGIVRVSGFDYTVRDLTEIEHLRNEVIGFHDGTSLEIAIYPDLPAQREVEVMIHEILHAMFHGGDLDERDGPITEEKAVTVLARSAVALIRDNPGLMAWIAQKLA